MIYFVEFFVDKIPGVDSFWYAVRTFIRILVHVMLAAGTIGVVLRQYW
ncbi:DUF4126 domain-containing protein [Nitrosomonas aestuarii]